jgi:hypothetical protein
LYAVKVIITEDCGRKFYKTEKPERVGFKKIKGREITRGNPSGLESLP